MATAVKGKRRENSVILDLKVARLQIGDVIVEGKNKRTEVKEITLCTSDCTSLHVNKSDCYWVNGIVSVERILPDKDWTPAERLLYAIFANDSIGE
jgi:hypothetical protein